MPIRSSLYSETGVVHLLSSAPRQADANSTGMDLRDADSAALLFTVGANGDTLSGSVYIELEVEESDDNSTWNDVANLDLTNYATGTTNTGTAAKIVANAGAANSYLVGYKGNKRYIRGVVNITGTHTTGTPVGVVGLRGNNHYQPANVNT
ncbi:hypothetical protein [Phenylobacterium sp.]|uniref:hypothetical protein n=1 Tax=Phenylobacterium sp. TaxID=1871053 RepID=UPI00301BD9D8